MKILCVLVTVVFSLCIGAYAQDRSLEARQRRQKQEQNQLIDSQANDFQEARANAARRMEDKRKELVRLFFEFSPEDRKLILKDIEREEKRIRAGFPKKK